MKKTTHKLLSGILATSLVLSALPVTLADSTEHSPEVTPETTQYTQTLSTETIQTINFQGSTYALLNLGLDWNGAKAYCESLGGHLATITSQAEDEFLFDYVTGLGHLGVSFGLYIDKTINQWFWVTGEPFVYHNWSTGEPNNLMSREWSGMYYFDDGTWNDSTGEKIPFLCEWEGENAYNPLPSATLYSSYLTKLTNVGKSATLVAGSLPPGLGIYTDGSLGGVPSKSGTYHFTLRTSTGDLSYTLTVLENTTENVEADNDFEIIDRMPTVTQNESDYSYKVDGDYTKFLNVYLDGVPLVPEIEYTIEPGSTKITVLSSTVAQLNEGSHTINATFAPVFVSTATTATQVNVYKVAQTFEKTVEKTTEPALPFTDVKEADWFYSPVSFVYKHGAFTGTSDSTYSPDEKMTRGMLASVLYSLADKPETDLADLTDVPSWAWYSDAVNWVVSRGIDDSVDTFRPTELVTREETAKMMYNFCTDQEIWLPLTTSEEAKDLDSVSESARLHVNTLFQQGIFTGDQHGNFNPQNTSSRAEVSVIVNNFISGTL